MATEDCLAPPAESRAAVHPQSRNVSGSPKLPASCQFWAPPTEEEGAPTVALDPLIAAGRLLDEIAGNLHSAIQVTHEAIGCDKPSDVLVALASLLKVTGALADRAARACGGATGLAGAADMWLLSPYGEDNLRALEAPRAQPLASEGAGGAA